VEDIAWMSWPQAKKPFEAAEIDYIRNLNGIRDAKRLGKALGIRRECLRLLETTTTLLQLAVEHGLTLYDIGTIMYREDAHGDDAQPSALENIIESSLDVSIVIAADSCAASAVSPALSSLDLQTCRASLDSLRSPPFSSQLSPFTPMSSASSPVVSPSMPPQLLLPSAESRSDVVFASPDVEQSTESMLRTFPWSFTRAHSLDDIEDLEPQGPRPRLKAYKDSAAPGVAARRAVVERERGSAQGIFTRSGLSASDWTPELERAFRVHLEAGIKDYLKKHFPRS